MAQRALSEEVGIGTVLLFYSAASFRRDDWRHSLVTGETKACWLLENGDRPNKKTLLTAADRQGYRTRYYTKRQMDNKFFCDANARSISSAVSVCDDPDILRQIAKLIGKEI